MDGATGPKRIRPVKLVSRWCCRLFGARCKWFVYGPADVTATASSCNPEWLIYLSAAGLPRLSWKRIH